MQKWMQAYAPTNTPPPPMPPPPPDPFYDVLVKNQTGIYLTLYVYYQTPPVEEPLPSGGSRTLVPASWRTLRDIIKPGEYRLGGLETRNRYIYFRAEGGNRVWQGGSTDSRVLDGRQYQQVNMGPTVNTYIHIFE
jgi:hypothetical protein